MEATWSKKKYVMRSVPFKMFDIFDFNLVLVICFNYDICPWGKYLIGICVILLYVHACFSKEDFNCLFTSGLCD